MLDEWTARASDSLGLPAEPFPTKELLDLARDAAHAVARPAAPLTTYLVGVAVGRGQSLPQALATVRELMGSWPARAE